VVRAPGPRESVSNCEQELGPGARAASIICGNQRWQATEEVAGGSADVRNLARPMKSMARFSVQLNAGVCRVAGEPFLAR
jgi:hypothetical protein